jgi:hypothetical protein
MIPCLPAQQPTLLNIRCCKPAHANFD